MYARQLVQRENHLQPIRQMLKSDRNPFNVEPLHQDLSRGVNTPGVLDYLKNYDITRLLSPNVLNETFPCHFISGNLAWMSEQNGHYRYFTRNYKGHSYSLDLIDFLSIYYETEDISDIIKRLSNKAGVIYLDKRWRTGQSDKYRTNIAAFNVKDFSTEHQKLLEPLKVVYAALNEEGLRHLGPMNLSLGHEAMFFVSQRYLGTKTGLSSSQVSRIILMLQYLGLIESVSDENIPESYLEKSMSYAKNRKRINYYTIPAYGDKIDIIVQKCSLAIGKGLKMSNVSISTIAKMNELYQKR